MVLQPHICNLMSVMLPKLKAVCMGRAWSGTSPWLPSGASTEGSPPCFQIGAALGPLWLSNLQGSFFLTSAPFLLARVTLWISVSLTRSGPCRWLDRFLQLNQPIPSHPLTQSTLTPPGLLPRHHPKESLGLVQQGPCPFNKRSVLALRLRSSP